jgi:hypothetical protein
MSPARLQSLIALPVVLLATAISAPAAAADVGETIIQRCTHGQSLAGFSQSAYSKALKELSADAQEYTNCASLIRQAQLAAASGGGAGSGAETVAAIPATPAEQTAIAHAAKAGSGPVTVGGQLIRPGVVHADVASAFSSIPSPLLATVAFLIACVAVVAGGALRNRFRGERPD